MTEAPLLEFQQVTFGYHKELVLRDLSLSVSGGELVAFLGVNGAGKTTTFLLAAGLLYPRSGAIAMTGVDPAKSRDWTRQVGVVTADAGLYPRLTVRRNLQFYAELYSLSIDLDSHLKEHGLERFAGHKAGQLSQGYTRRLSLARATLHKPKLLLLDEPADGLDPAATDQLHRYLLRYVENGGGVLFTSHRLEEVETLAQRVLILDGGKVALESRSDKLAELGCGRTLREIVLALGDSGQERSPEEANSKIPGETKV